MSSDNFGIFVLIPEDVLIKIFSYLPEEDLQRVRLICRRFKQIICNSSSLLRAFEIGTFQLKRSIKWIKKSKYSNLSLQCGFLNIKKLTRTMEIMGCNLYRLDLRLSE